MGEDREALAEAMLACLREQQPLYYEDSADECAAALLPVVDAIARRRAAAVLRAAAQEQRNEAENVPDTDEGTHADGHRCAATFLDRRADALDSQ